MTLKFDYAHSIRVPRKTPNNHVARPVPPPIPSERGKPPPQPISTKPNTEVKSIIEEDEIPWDSDLQEVAPDVMAEMPTLAQAEPPWEITPPPEKILIASSDSDPDVPFMYQARGRMAMVSLDLLLELEDACKDLLLTFTKGGLSQAKTMSPVHGQDRVTVEELDLRIVRVVGRDWQ